MKKDNNLSNNLRVYQTERHETLSEFSRELGVAKSTLQSVMVDGNTTVDTLIRIANALGATLDDLVFGAIQPIQTDQIQNFLHNIGWYAQLTPEKQELFRYHLGEILRLFSHEG